MSGTQLSPEDSLRLDNLASSVALLMAEIRADKAQRTRLEASLGRIERAVAVPAVYNLKQACQRLGRSLSWGQHNMDKLPRPIGKMRPLRFRIEEVEAMVTEQGNDPKARMRMARERSAS